MNKICPKNFTKWAISGGHLLLRPPTKMLGGRVLPSPYNRRPWPTVIPCCSTVITQCACFCYFTDVYPFNCLITAMYVYTVGGLAQW